MTSLLKRTLSGLVEDTVAPAVDKPPKKPRSESKPRPPARPFKRLDNIVLSQRLVEMEQRINVIRSKLVLMEDRHSEHEKEKKLRATLAAEE